MTAPPGVSRPEFLLTEKRIERARREWDELAVAEEQGLMVQMQRLRAALDRESAEE